MTAISLGWFEDEQRRDLMRWAGAAAIVLGVHAAAIAFYLVSHQPEQIGGDDFEVAIELAPIENTPDAVERDVTPAPETMIESKALPKPPDTPPPEEKVEQAPPEETPTIVPEQAEQPPEKVEEPKPPAPVTAQRAKGGAQQIASAWENSVVKHLQRYKRYPSEALSRSAFSLNRARPSASSPSAKPIAARKTWAQRPRPMVAPERVRVLEPLLSPARMA